MADPIACPHCGGRVVNGVDIDFQLYNVFFDDEGGWLEGSWEDESVSPSYPSTMFVCHTCHSEFLPPPDVVGTFSDSLPDSGDVEKIELINHSVFWVPVEDTLLPTLIKLLDQPTTATLRERLLALTSDSQWAQLEDPVKGLQQIRKDLAGD